MAPSVPGIGPKTKCEPGTHGFGGSPTFCTTGIARSPAVLPTFCIIRPKGGVLLPKESHPNALAAVASKLLPKVRGHPRPHHG
jgi:hypothetical protein